MYIVTWASTGLPEALCHDRASLALPSSVPNPVVADQPQKLDMPSYDPKPAPTSIVPEKQSEPSLAPPAVPIPSFMPKPTAPSLLQTPASLSLSAPPMSSSQGKIEPGKASRNPSPSLPEFLPVSCLASAPNAYLPAREAPQSLNKQAALHQHQPPGKAFSPACGTTSHCCS